MDPPRQLHVTQPAVTQQIQSLEKELNVKLFIRTTRTVHLTEEGKVFLNDARQLVAISNRAKKDLKTQMAVKFKSYPLVVITFRCFFTDRSFTSAI